MARTHSVTHQLSPRDRPPADTARCRMPGKGGLFPVRGNNPSACARATAQPLLSHGIRSYPVLTGRHRTPAADIGRVLAAAGSQVLAEYEELADLEPVARQSTVPVLSCGSRPIAPVLYYLYAGRVSTSGMPSLS